MHSTSRKRSRWTFESASLILLACVLRAPPAHAQAAGAEDLCSPGPVSPDPVLTEGSWFAGAGQAICRAEFEFTRLDGGVWSAPNRPHELRVRLDRHGIEVFPRSAGAGSEEPPWKLQLSTISFGRDGEQTRLGAASVCVAGARAELDHGGLVEWFVNDERGIEQGWTLSNRPSGSGPLVIGLRVQGDLHMGSDAPRDERVFLDSEGETRIRYGDLVSWDATGQSLETWITNGTEGPELHVDDTSATYPVTVDPLMQSAAWIVDGNQASAHLGNSVSSAGDVNGDGFDDIIIGADRYDNGTQDEGRVFLFFGSAQGPSPTVSWTVGGIQLSAHLGSSVSTAGDVNGDGYDDIIISGVGVSGPKRYEGRAYVYHGSPTGPSTVESWSAGPDQLGARYGTSVSGAGDVNGDGFDDVIVGANNYTSHSFYGGRAYVYHGSSRGLSKTPAWIVEGDQALAKLGEDVSDAGDVNGDGFDDVIVGATGVGNGRAYVFHGSPTGLGATAAWTGKVNTSSANYGSSVSTAGDVNGDGFDDVIVGDPLHGNGQANEGRALVYHGSVVGLSPTEDWAAESNQVQAFFGGATAAAGDVNGDGFGDVVVRAGSYDNGQVNEGRAFVFLGSAGGLEAAASWTAESNQAQAYFGLPASTAGDVNGDGASDLLIGASLYDSGQTNEGRAYLYLGTPPGGPSQYCFAGISTSGCQAQIISSGTPSATAPAGFSLHGLMVEGSKDGLFFFGANGRQSFPWGTSSSFQCVVPPVQRAALLSGSGTPGLCDGTFGQDLNSLWCPTCPSPGKNPGAGAVVQAQLWYRDPLNTSNQTTSLSDAIEFTVQP